LKGSWKSLKKERKELKQLGEIKENNGGGPLEKSKGREEMEVH